MVVRARKIDWRLLTEPTSRGIEIEAAADARMHASIQRSVSNVGSSIVRSRGEKENKRRSDRDFSLRQRSVSLREKEREDNLSLRREDKERQDLNDRASLEFIIGSGQEKFLNLGDDPTPVQVGELQDLVATGVGLAKKVGAQQPAPEAGQMVEPDGTPCEGAG